jgi:CRP-like cAMP-binding protein
VLRVIGALQTLGESSALLGRGSPYEAVAVQESKLVAIPAGSLFALLERDFRFARRLVTMLAERKAELYAEVESTALLSGRQRVATYLKTARRGRSAWSACRSARPGRFAARHQEGDAVATTTGTRRAPRHRHGARREIVILEPVSTRRELASSDQARSA